MILGSPLGGPYTIFVDDEPQTAIVTQRNGISVIFFNPSRLEDGAQISVASGGSCNLSDASVLTTRIRLPEGRKQPQRADADPGCSVKKIRTLRAHPGLRDRDEVEIQLTGVPFEVSNLGLVMQVGDLRVMGGYGADPRTLIFRMSAEEFSRVEDGKRINVKRGFARPASRASENLTRPSSSSRISRPLETRNQPILAALVPQKVSLDWPWDCYRRRFVFLRFG